MKNLTVSFFVMVLFCTLTSCDEQTKQFIETTKLLDSIEGEMAKNHAEMDSIDRAYQESQNTDSMSFRSGDSTLLIFKNEQGDTIREGKIWLNPKGK